MQDKTILEALSNLGYSAQYKASLRQHKVTQETRQQNVSCRPQSSADKADAGAGSADPARIARSIAALRRRVLGLPAWALSTLGRSTHRGKGEDYGK